MKRIATLAWQHGMIALLCFSMITMTACSVDQVLSDIDVVLQATANLSAAVGAVSPADGAAVTLITGLATAGINAIKTAYDTYEKNKTASNLQNVVVAAQAIQTNLPQELAAYHISDPVVVQKCTAWVALVTDTAQAIVATVQGTQPATATQGRVTTLAMPTPESLQARWQANVCSGDVSCGALVKVHHKHLSWRM